MSYRSDCRWLILTIKGRKCSKGATTMKGCPDDCPLYEKR